jgi:hypothetical protein
MLEMKEKNSDLFGIIDYRLEQRLGLIQISQNYSEKHLIFSIIFL